MTVLLNRRRIEQVLFAVLAFLLAYGASEFWREVRYAAGRADRDQWLGLHEEQDLRHLTVRGSLGLLTETISYHSDTTDVRAETISLELPDDLGCVSATTHMEDPQSLVVAIEGRSHFEYRFLEAPCPTLPFASLRIDPAQDARRRVTHFDYDGDTRFDAYCSGTEGDGAASWHILLRDGQIREVEIVVNLDAVWTAKEIGGESTFRFMDGNWSATID